MLGNLFKNNRSDQKETGINWEALNSVEQLEKLKEVSSQQKVLIFKHSTRCSISSSALNRLERNWKEEEMTHIKPFFLDLIQFRELSNQIAQEFQVPHQSPQVIVLENAQAIYDNSHMGISYSDLKDL